MRNKKLMVALGLAAVVSAGAASAQTTGIDVSSVTAVISEAVTAAATIGAAYLAMVAGVRLYKWIRGAL